MNVREIKFRVYDQKLAMMFDVAQLDWPLGLTIRGVKGDSGGEQFVTRGYIGKNYMDKKRFALMQYTGLKDKNGKEIYEGDLIMITDPFINQEAIGVAKIVFSYDYVGGWVAEHGDEHLNIGTRTHMVSVVGNIYENPELINS